MSIDWRSVGWNLVIGGMTCCVGCSGLSTDSTTFPIVHDATYVGSEGQAQAMDRNREIEHDFGLLRPGQRVNHRFAVQNDSPQAWTFKRFHENCRCTVTHASVTGVLPGHTAEVDVTYTAPDSNADDRRSVKVEFHELGAPLLSLVVKAQVRQLLTISPAKLEFPRVARGESPERTLEIHNFSDRAGKSITVESSVPWLLTDCVFVGDGTTPREPIQLWRVIVRANTTDLPHGRHQGELQVSLAADTPPSLVTVRVPVNIHVAAPVEAMPASMFFGTLNPGQAATRKVLLRFASPPLRVSPDDFVFEHDFGNDLTFEVRPDTSGRFTEIAATLLTRKAGVFFQGTLTVRFPNTGLPDIQIPIYARVGEPL